MSTDQKRFRTPKFRVAFPQLFQAKAFDEKQEPKFSVMMLFDKEAQATPEFKAIVKRVAEIRKEKWGDKPPKNLKMPFKKGEKLQNNETGKYYGGCDEDTVAISAQGKFAPDVLNQKKHLLRAGVAADEAQLYAGCYAIATVTPQIFELPQSKGVTLYLGNVMKLAEGEPLGGKVSADQDFDDIEAIEVDTDVNLDGEDSEVELDDIPL